jgi:hypothetical protein
MQVPHQKSAADCDLWCKRAETNVCIELLIVVRSGTTPKGATHSCGVVGLADPTLAQLLKHAERFGVECVFETADHVLPEGELRQLDRELTRIEPKRKRVYTALAEEEEHERIIELNKTLSVAEVAKEVKRSQSYVRRVLKEAGTPVSPVLSAKSRRRKIRSL